MTTWSPSARAIRHAGQAERLVASAKLRAQAQDQATETTRADILLAVSRAYFSVLRAEAVLQVAQQTVSARQLIVDQITALAREQTQIAVGRQLREREPGRCAGCCSPARKTTSTPPRPSLRRPWACPARPASPWKRRSCPIRCRTRSSRCCRKRCGTVRNWPICGCRRARPSGSSQAEHALYYPSIGVAGTAGFVPTGQVQIPGRYGAVGVNVNIPIFNGGLFKARQAEAELKARAVGQNVTAAENRVVRDVRRRLPERAHRQ